MARGTRQQRERQQGLWIPAADIRRGGGHPFYQRLNALLKELIRNEASPSGRRTLWRCTAFCGSHWTRPCRIIPRSRGPAG